MGSSYAADQLMTMEKIGQVEWGFMVTLVGLIGQWLFTSLRLYLRCR